MKKSKFIALFLCCMLLCLCLSGCGGDNSKSYIQYDTGKSTMTLNKVTYYDFYSERLISNYSGKCTVISNSLNSTEVTFVDSNKKTRVACFNKALSTKPSSVRIYKNYLETTYETYKCKY